MDQVQHATRAVHHIEVELLRQTFPRLERELVEVRVGVEVVIRADDRRVAAGVTAAQPTLLEHGDILQAMLLGEVVRRREAMAAAADDDRIVARLRHRAAPGERPVLVPRERVARDREDRVFQRGYWRRGRPLRSNVNLLIVHALHVTRSSLPPSWPTLAT